MGTPVMQRDGGRELAEFIAANGQQIAEATPTHIRAETITRTLLAAVREEPKLGRCTKESLVKCLRKAAITGLEIGTQAFLIPYGKDAQFQISYKGYKELVRRAGMGSVAMEAVHEGDDFESRGTFALPRHIACKNPKRRFSKLTHAYAAWIPRDGSAPVVSVWTREECMAHRDHYSRGVKDKDSPWHEDNPAFRVMCMKTALLDLVNRGDLPLSSEICEMARQELHNFVDVTQSQALPPTTDDEAAAAHAAAQLTNQTPSDPGEVTVDMAAVIATLPALMADAEDPEAEANRLIAEYPDIDGDIVSAKKAEVRKREEASK